MSVTRCSINNTGEIPQFNSRGRLPRGVYNATWEEFKERFVYNERRERLMQGLLSAAHLLKIAECRRIYIGGSFVSSKQKPNDVDVVWDSRMMNWVLLKYIAPVFFEMTPGSPQQKKLFGGEFFPSQGIEIESGLTFLDFFQRDRQDRAVGVILLELEDI